MKLAIQEETKKEKISNYQKILCSTLLVLHANTNRNNNYNELGNDDSNFYVLEPYKFNGVCQKLIESKNDVIKDANADKSFDIEKGN